MRAREPDQTGYVERDGIRVYYEAFGSSGPWVVFTPADTIVESRMWKAQVHYLARRHRVVVIDPRGNGRSDRPVGPEFYTDATIVDDLLAVMDTVGVERAVLVGLCDSGWFGLLAASRHPERVAGVVAIGPGAQDGTPRIDRGLDLLANWTADLTKPQGWQLFNRTAWREEWQAWISFFFSQICNEPHSTKVYEDVVGWAGQTNGEIMVSMIDADCVGDSPDRVAKTLRSIACPVLVIHGTHDWCQPFARGAHMARLAGAELVALGGSGHLPPGRDPVAVNHVLADFVRRVGAGDRAAGDGRADLRARSPEHAARPGPATHRGAVRERWDCLRGRTCVGRRAADARRGERRGLAPSAPGAGPPRVVRRPRRRHGPAGGADRRAGGGRWCLPVASAPFHGC